MSAQHARTQSSSVIKKTYHSQFPALIVKRRNEHVVTETVYCDTLEINNGSTYVKLLLDTKTLLNDFYWNKSDEIIRT